MGKDGGNTYCPIGDMDSEWCAHCRDAASGLSGAERAARDKSIPPANASIGWSSRAGAQSSSDGDGKQDSWVGVDEAMRRGKLGRGLTHEGY